MIVALFVVALLGAVVPGLRLVPARNLAGRGFWVAAACSLLLAVAMFVGSGGLAGLLATPWLLVAVTLALIRLPGLWARRRSIRTLANEIAADAAAGFMAIGAVWALISCLGLRPMGLDVRIVLLTAVHFHVAGFVVVLAGELLRRRRPSRFIALGLAALIVGIPTTAIGFLGVPVVALVGAWLVASGGFIVGLGHLDAARSGRAEVPLGPAASVAGVALLLSMPLAAAWATTSWLGIGFLPLSVMAAAHGGLNVLGFGVPAMFAWRQSPLTAPPSSVPLAVQQSP